MAGLEEGAQSPARARFRDGEEEAVTSRLTSRGADRWDRMSATAREKKQKEGTRALAGSSQLLGWLRGLA